MADAPRPLIAGNWKMNGLCETGRALTQAVVKRWRAADRGKVDLLLCPPATLLGMVGEALKGSGILLGAQDCHSEKPGAHTGDIAAVMLADIGCRFVVLGHSERRQAHRETDALVRAKVRAAHTAGLTVILCVGESAAERQAGRAEAIVGAQLDGSLPDGASDKNTVIAYEPVWAIGSGKTPAADDIRAMHAWIRARLGKRFGGADALRILYGGSVTSKNAPDILPMPEVNGALVGGASLDAEEFCRIASCG
ncbi:MAG: triose-phosphate isomerase [Pseudomonadota bacterium]